MRWKNKRQKFIFPISTVCVCMCANQIKEHLYAALFFPLLLLNSINQQSIKRAEHKKKELDESILTDKKIRVRLKLRINHF